MFVEAVKLVSRRQEHSRHGAIIPVALPTPAAMSLAGDCQIWHLQSKFGKMVILREPFGGLSNRLIQHVHFHSFCLENRTRFLNPFISDFWQRFPRPLRQMRHLSALQFVSGNANYSDLERLMITQPLTFVEGWPYRNLPLTRKYRDHYRRTMYEINPPIDARTVLSPTKANIAVHIRRGGYATWQNGKYFYPNDVYLSAIERVLDFIEAKPRLVIFTDDTCLDRVFYQRICDDVVFSDHGLRADHYLMSRCDYIIGPPSTFSQWASYIGKTKYCHIHSAYDQIEQD